MESNRKIILSNKNHLRLIRKKSGWRPKTAVVSRSIGSFRAECVRAAREIGQTYCGQDIFLFLSGGMDSEIIAEAFRLSKTPFHPLILKFEEDLNKPDCDRALAWCRKRGIKPKIVPFPILPFFSSQWVRTTLKKYPHSMAMYLVLMRALHDLPQGSVGILGTGEPILIHRGKKDFLEEELEDANLLRYAMDSNRPFVTHFFYWSPELYFSFITSPEYIEFVKQKGEIYHRSSPLKEKLYRREFKLKERKKLHGFELTLRKYPTLMNRIRNQIKIKSFFRSYRAEIAYLASKGRD